MFREVGDAIEARGEQRVGRVRPIVRGGPAGRAALAGRIIEGGDRIMHDAIDRVRQAAARALRNQAIYDLARQIGENIPPS